MGCPTRCYREMQGVYTGCDKKNMSGWVCPNKNMVRLTGGLLRNKVLIKKKGNACKEMTKVNIYSFYI